MIGKILGKRYQIVEKIAVGGMSTVYKALDINLKRYDAVKILKEEFAQNEEFVEQFRQEANSVAGLNHPNIVNIYNVGSEGDLQYIVMEYIKGKTLKRLIRERGRLFQDQAVSYSEQIARALQHAHNNGIIHRDIKPHNILITDDDRVKIFDFGIAKHSDSSTITNSGRIIGSVHYFSPEQARGLMTDLRSDIYSLGIVMYEMVTGRLPFDSESPVTIALKHMQEPVVPPNTINPGISDKLNAVIMKAVSKDPIDRYQTTEEMLTDLGRIKGPNPLIYAEAAREPNERHTVMDSTQVLAPVRVGRPLTAKNRIASLPDEDEFSFEELGKAQVREKQRNKSLMGLLLLLMVILAGVSYAGIRYFNGLSARRQAEASPRTMSMINIVGLDEAKARLELSKFQIRLEPNYVISDSPGGTVLGSDPAAGDPVMPGGKVTARISRPEEIVKVPDFSGMDREQAVAALTAAGLKPGAVTENYHDYIQSGRVISSDPASGWELEKGGPVSLLLSKGKDPDKMDLIVPDLKNLTPEDAEAALTAAGLRLGTISFADVSEEDFNGMIVSQSLERGTFVIKDTLVHVEVGRYVASTAPSTTVPKTKPSTRPAATQPSTTPDTEPSTTPDTEPSTTPDTEPDTEPGTTTPDTEPSTTSATKPSTTTGTKPSTTTPQTKPSTQPPASVGELKERDLLEQKYIDAQRIAKAAGYDIGILNLYNPDGSKVSTATKERLLARGKIVGVVEEVTITGRNILVNVMSTKKIS